MFRKLAHAQSLYKYKIRYQVRRLVVCSPAVNMASRVWTLPLVRRLFLHSPALTSCRSLTPVSSCSQRYVNDYRGGEISDWCRQKRWLNDWDNFHIFLFFFLQILLILQVNGINRSQILTSLYQTDPLTSHKDQENIINISDIM